MERKFSILLKGGIMFAYTIFYVIVAIIIGSLTDNYESNENLVEVNTSDITQYNSNFYTLQHDFNYRVEMLDTFYPNPISFDTNMVDSHMYAYYGKDIEYRGHDVEVEIEKFTFVYFFDDFDIGDSFYISISEDNVLDATDTLIESDYITSTDVYSTKIDASIYDDFENKYIILTKNDKSETDTSKVDEYFIFDVSTFDDMGDYEIKSSNYYGASPYYGLSNSWAIAFGFTFYILPMLFIGFILEFN